MAQASNVIPFPEKPVKSKGRRNLKWAPVSAFSAVKVNFKPANPEEWASSHLAPVLTAIELANNDCEQLAARIGKMTEKERGELLDWLAFTQDHLSACASIIGTVRVRVEIVEQQHLHPAGPEAA